MPAPVLRPEHPSDAAAIEAIHRAAFGGPKEAAVVADVRAEGAIVLSLVAERGGTIAGHVLFCRLTIVADAMPDRFAVALAPLAIHPDHQGHGLGPALIGEGLARLKVAGESLVFVYGKPALYARFGFSPATAIGFSAFRAGPSYQALALAPDAPHPPARVDYPAAFRHVM
jgi:putative acetyltransferase